MVWQDSTPEGYFARVRTLDRKTDSWSETWTLGEGRDNHARPTITIDSEGRLHVIIGGHHTGLQYRKSVRINDASEWKDPVAFGKSTYPVLICDASDTLHLTGRHDQDWKGIDHYIKPKDGDWEHRGLLVKKQDRHEFYGAYHNSLAWGPDHRSLHLSTGFFMGLRGDASRQLLGLHQAVGYMQSEDLGMTWSKADGNPIQTPSTTETIDLLEEGERDAEDVDLPKPGIQHCGLAVDSMNRPYVVYVRHTPDPMRAYLKSPGTDGRWTEHPLGEAIQDNWPEWGFLGCRVSMTDEDVLCLLITLVPREHPEANWSPGIWGRPAFWLRDYPYIHRIVWLESRDSGQTFTPRAIVPHLLEEGTLLPHLEQPTGFNRIKGRLPGFLYIEGLSRYTEEGEVIDNKVYFSEIEE